MFSTGGVFGGRLDKKSLDVVQHQLLENGLDLGEIQECSLMDNERGGTFFLKFSTAEAVLRVWDRHCSWWAFEFAQQSDREVWALRLAEAAGIPVPSVMATGTMEQVNYYCLHCRVCRETANIFLFCCHSCYRQILS